VVIEGRACAVHENVMKSNLSKCALAFLLLSSGIARGFCQAFTNLNFESANISNLPTNESSGVPVTLGMPGWTASPTAPPDEDIVQNGISAGGALVAIEGPHYDSSFIIQGKYTAYISGSYFGTPSSADIAQTGFIPALTQSIVFDTSLDADFQVTLDGQIIATSQIGTGANYVIMGGDVSAFANQQEQLQFTALPNVGGGFLDNIQFLTTPVPEPPALALIGTGAVLLGLRTGRKKA
jgi:hypothetical protein